MLVGGLRARWLDPAFLCSAMPGLCCVSDGPPGSNSEMLIRMRIDRYGSPMQFASELSSDLGF